jgi:hypothetical protein
MLLAVLTVMATACLFAVCLGFLLPSERTASRTEDLP